MPGLVVPAFFASAAAFAFAALVAAAF